MMTDDKLLVHKKAIVFGQNQKKDGVPRRFTSVRVSSRRQPFMEALNSNLFEDAMNSIKFVNRMAAIEQRVELVLTMLACAHK